MITNLRKVFLVMVLLSVLSVITYGQQVVQNQAIRLNGPVVVQQDTIVRNCYIYGQGVIIIPRNVRVAWQNNKFDLRGNNQIIIYRRNW